MNAHLRASTDTDRELSLESVQSHRIRNISTVGAKRSHCAEYGFHPAAEKEIVRDHNMKGDVWVVLYPGGKWAILTFGGKDTAADFGMFHPLDVVE